MESMMTEYIVWFSDGEIEVVESPNVVDAMIQARELHVSKGMTWHIHSVHLVCILRRVV